MLFLSIPAQHRSVSSLPALATLDPAQPGPPHQGQPLLPCHLHPGNPVCGHRAHDSQPRGDWVRGPDDPVFRSGLSLVHLVEEQTHVLQCCYR